ncbi:MAG: chitobiase/beta-hexosaminidase C-terminal domain-containing protein [Lachnospiraceae bacterium]|nr:chitobiase/beta-hexosaminidase C-terminal domain-containing protein [Lachnospiraceae bacterium]
MRCKECGIEVNSTDVFCPKCGAPLRITADYELIQAEIGGKVDKFMNDKDVHPVKRHRKTSPTEKKSYDGRTIAVPAAVTSKPGAEITIIGEKPRDENSEYDTIAITKAIYGKDSIFAADGKLDVTEEDSYPVSDTVSVYDDSDTETEDVYEEVDEATLERSKNNRINKNQKPNRSDNKEYYRIKVRARERKKKKQRLIILIAAIAVVVIGAIVGIIIATSSKKENNQEEELADEITCNLIEGGSYSAPLEIILKSEKDYLIRYSLDGSDPSTKSEKYGQPIQLDNEDASPEGTTYTLKAASYNNSIKKTTFTVNFTLTTTSVEAPYMDLESGDYYEKEYIGIYGPEGAAIYYTYDGSTPSVLSTLYTEPIAMERGNHILNAIAVDKNGIQSEVTSCVYNLVIESYYTYDEALAIVMDELLAQGLIESNEPDENKQYPVPGGGTRRIINGGIALIDNEQYYVIQVDFTNDGSTVQATTYYGVNDQDGEVNKLNKSGMEFTIA